MNGRRTAIMAAVITLAAVFFVIPVLAQSACDVPKEIKVVLLEAQWKFDVKSGILSGEGMISNISKVDAVAPGVAIGVFSSTGESMGTVLQRSSEARLAPGGTTSVKFSINLKVVPASFMFTPFEGIQST